MVKKIKALFVPQIFLIAFFLTAIIDFNSCTFGMLDGISTAAPSKESAQKKKNWTFMVYMAADNNLESAALEDFNEMEAADFDSSQMNVIVLFDRNDYKDCNDLDEWHGCRMYEIVRDVKGMNNEIRSRRISCADLGIGLKHEAFLDMGSPKTLELFMKNVKTDYPAEHYGLFVWGHGTGYRNENSRKDKIRAVALDDGDDTFMENCVVASAIKKGMDGEKLNLLAYDTCFASELEVVYEFPEVAESFVGTQGIQVESGFNYTKVFSTTLSKSRDGKEAGKIIASVLSDDMKNDFPVIDLSEIKNVFSSFESFASSAASFISNDEIAEEIRELVLSDTENFRSFESVSNPVYVNLASFADLLARKIPNLVSYKNNLISSIKKAVCFYAGTNENIPLGVYFCSVDYANDLIMDFSPYYCNGNDLKNMCSFVKDSKSYVLTKEKKGTLMDRLFENYDF